MLVLIIILKVLTKKNQHKPRNNQKKTDRKHTKTEKTDKRATFGASQVTPKTLNDHQQMSKRC